MDETEQQDEVETQNCLAKAAYIEWAAATIRMVHSG